MPEIQVNPNTTKRHQKKVLKLKQNLKQNKVPKPLMAQPQKTACSLSRNHLKQRAKWNQPLNCTNNQASKQASKRASKQASKQASKRASKRAKEQRSKREHTNSFHWTTEKEKSTVHSGAKKTLSSAACRRFRSHLRRAETPVCSCWTRWTFEKPMLPSPGTRTRGDGVFQAVWVRHLASFCCHKFYIGMLSRFEPLRMLQKEFGGQIVDGSFQRFGVT